jgi:hypothetical protein
MEDMTLATMLKSEQEFDPAISSRVIMSIKRETTSRKCVASIYKAARDIMAMEQKPFAAMIFNVGMRIEGNSANYDIWFFPASSHMFYVDSDNHAIVYAATEHSYLVL